MGILINVQGMDQNTDVPIKRDLILIKYFNIYSLFFDSFSCDEEPK